MVVEAALNKAKLHTVHSLSVHGMAWHGIVKPQRIFKLSTLPWRTRGSACSKSSSGSATVTSYLKAGRPTAHDVSASGKGARSMQRLVQCHSSLRSIHSSVNTSPPYPAFPAGVRSPTYANAQLAIGKNRTARLPNNRSGTLAVST